MTAGTVIVGAGQAGAQLATSLREAGYAEPITLIGDESHAPYHRPPLSKDYMAGKVPESELPIRTPEYYRERDIALRTGVSATRIHCDIRQLTLSGGEIMDYEHLVLATGARNRRLDIPGGAPANVYYLRTREDADALRTALAHARTVLIVGAGFIGLEFASVAAAAGAYVTVIEAGERVMDRAVSPRVSAFFTDRHRADGTEIRCGTTVETFGRDRNGLVTGAYVDGVLHSADMVLVGIGVLPNSDLAAAAGLEIGNGIVVDARLATSDPAISAIGDCAALRRGPGAGPVRVESVQNAADQARFLARRITGSAAEYNDLPWFWSHQAGAKLQIAGLAEPTDESVPLGDPGAAPRFSVCRLRDDVLTAVESVNSPGDHLAARRLLTSGERVTGRDLRSPGFSLRTADRAPAIA